jgi:hypothetical protein
LSTGEFPKVDRDTHDEREDDKVILGPLCSVDRLNATVVWQLGHLELALDEIALGVVGRDDAEGFAAVVLFDEGPARVGLLLVLGADLECQGRGAE